MDVLINPAACFLGTANAVLSGRGTSYATRFRGPLSVKSVLRGVATWETEQGRFELVPGAVLLLNEEEEYTVTIEALHSVETFCLFFERGFVEDAWRAATTSSASLLDSPQAETRVMFAERLRFDAPLVSAMRDAHARMRDGDTLAESFDDVALALVQTQVDVASRVSRLPALRASTRAELARRVALATSYLHANLERRVSIAEAARAAALSPFHFHRLFAAFHGTTPHRYLTRLRLERARALLRATDAPVLDVALSCGFESLGSFTSLFTRTFGVPPRTFARSEKRAARASATFAS